MTEQREGLSGYRATGPELEGEVPFVSHAAWCAGGKSWGCRGQSQAERTPRNGCCASQGEKAAVQVRVGTPERGKLTLAHVQVEPDLAGSIHETA